MILQEMQQFCTVPKREDSAAGKRLKAATDPIRLFVVGDQTQNKCFDEAHAFSAGLLYQTALPIDCQKWAVPCENPSWPEMRS